MSEYNAVRFLLAFSLCAGLAYADLKLDVLSEVRAFLSQGLAPFHFVAEVPRRVFRGGKDYLAARGDLLAEKEDLERRLREQNIKLKSLDFFVAQNDEYRRLLRLKTLLGGELRPAGVVRNAAHLQSERMFLDQGLAAGILPGNGVVDENGAVGQILRVDTDASVVNLLTDSNHRLMTRVRRNGLLAIARGAGDGSGEMVVEHMAAGADIAPGDQLIAAGVVFPPGYPVGEVLSVQTEAVFLRVRVRPASRLTDSGAVLVYLRPAAEQ